MHNKITLALKVTEADDRKDVGKGIARVDYNVMCSLGVSREDIIEISFFCYDGRFFCYADIRSSQNIVNGRGTSTVTAIAYDATTDKKIGNAVVKVKITFTSNDTSKEIVGHNGEVTYSAEIKPNSKDNSDIGFKTTVQAFASGYISTSKASSYSSSSSTLIMTDNSHHESIINNS
jgi:hypothetical protein